MRENLLALVGDGDAIQHIAAPNDCKPGAIDASSARCHGDFDDDKPTVQALLARILGFGVLFGKGTMFGGPKLVRPEVVATPAVAA